MSRIESYISAFDPGAAAGDVVERIEIPLIQRDYAQGRRNAKADEIRATFLEVLHSAVSGSDPEPVSLDFVYGEIEHGTLQPLDGQQRLTTLFLLHWYIAVRAGALDSDAPWTRFSYATRQSARRFCERLVRAVPPADVESLSDWIVDQSWYLFVWRHDPTIEAMLVMLDAIHDRFREVEPEVAWERLSDVDSPAVSFHLLPLPDMGSAEDLYIKMNSRGKPLTEFENFKAHFEKTIESSPRASEFAEKIDVAWTDLLWTYRGDDDSVDDEFLRYLEFITEVCEWTDPALGSGAGQTLTLRTESVFGEQNANRNRHLDFLFSALDIWVDRDIAATFGGLFGSLPLFFRSTDVNLFETCCRDYGETRGATRVFSFGQTLILYAVVLHLTLDSEDFARRVRTLRNLIEGSQFEMRAERMSRLVEVTRDLILDGSIPAAGGLTFSYPQIDDETAKATFRAENTEVTSALDALEDHPLLRGSTNAFLLDPRLLATRGKAFRDVIDNSELWSDAAAALLTFGDYQRPRGRDLANPRSFQLAATDADHSEVWRALLTGALRTDLAPTAAALAKFLDAVASSSDPLSDVLRKAREDWLLQRESRLYFDWRYYMVKYPGMREGGSGLYFTEDHVMGFSLCNLRGGKEQMNSLYRDPYLLAIYQLLGAPAEIDDPWFVGYEWDYRYLTIADKELGVRCDGEGFVVRAIDDEGDWSYQTHAVPRNPDDVSVDAEDRIEFGARLVSELLASIR